MRQLKQVSTNLEQESQVFEQDNGGLFEYVEGMPKARNRKKNYNKDQILNLIVAAQSMPYLGYWDAVRQTYVTEHGFEEASYAEVIAMRLVTQAAQGDIHAIKEVYDRTLGKPKQQTETIQTRMSYGEYLDYLALQDDGEDDDSPFTLPRQITLEMTPVSFIEQLDAEENGQPRRLTFSLDDL